MTKHTYGCVCRDCFPHNWEVCNCIDCIRIRDARDDARTELLNNQKPERRQGIYGKSQAAEAIPLMREYNEIVKDRIGNAAERKAVPLCTGFFDYFPDACIEVAKLSKKGNDQHNPGEPLHWARGKSGDEADALLRHVIDRGTVDTDGELHSAKLAWRSMANLQKELEEARGLPLSRGSRPAPK